MFSECCCFGPASRFAKVGAEEGRASALRKEAGRKKGPGLERRSGRAAPWASRERRSGKGQGGEIPTPDCTLVPRVSYTLSGEGWPLWWRAPGVGMLMLAAYFGCGVLFEKLGELQGLRVLCEERYLSSFLGSFERILMRGI